MIKPFLNGVTLIRKEFALDKFATIGSGAKSVFFFNSYCTQNGQNSIECNRVKKKRILFSKS